MFMPTHDPDCIAMTHLPHLLKVLPGRLLFDKQFCELCCICNRYTNAVPTFAAPADATGSLIDAMAPSPMASPAAAPMMSANALNNALAPAPAAAASCNSSSESASLLFIQQVHIKMPAPLRQPLPAACLPMHLAFIGRNSIDHDYICSCMHMCHVLGENLKLAPAGGAGCEY
jgi:hypothetical protein